MIIVFPTEKTVKKNLTFVQISAFVVDNDMHPPGPSRGLRGKRAPVKYPHCIGITSPRNIKLWEKAETADAIGMQRG